MADQQAAATVETPATTSAETENTETVTTPEHMIPKSRLDEATKRATDAEKKLKAFETAQAAADTAKLTEQQNFQRLYETEQGKAATLAAELEQIKADRRTDKIATAIEKVARDMKFAEPADAFRFIDLSKIEVDETSGEVKGADVLVKELAKAKSYLLAQTAPAQGNGQSPRPAGQAGAADSEATYQRNFERMVRSF